MISDPKNLRQISIPGLDTAAGWNEFAKRINSIWNSRAVAPLQLTKGGEWLLSGGDGIEPNPTGPFNAPIYRVFVDRGDGWDWGSTASPRAFYLAGTFTSYGGTTALRAAKFYRSPVTGSTVFSSAFAAANQFNGTTNFIQTTRDGNIIYGASVPRSRNGSGTNYAWILDPSSGDLVSGFNAVSSAAFLTTGLSSISCVDGYLAAMNPVQTNIYDLSTGSGSSASSDNNSHNVFGDDSSFYATGRRVNIFGLTNPKAFHKIGAGFSQDATWATNGGTGSGADLFSMAVPQKQVWNTNDESKLIYAVATLEYTGVDYTWNGTTAGGGSGLSSGNVIRYTNTGLLDALGSSFYFTRDTSYSDNSPRAELFCVDPDDVLFFGGGVAHLTSGVQDISVSPQMLYAFHPATQEFDVIDGFNGPVRDCQFFGYSSTGSPQYIVVGEFTEYNGNPAPYICFLDSGYNQISELEWL